MESSKSDDFIIAHYSITPLLQYSNDFVIPLKMNNKPRIAKFVRDLEGQEIISHQLRHGGQGGSSGNEVAPEFFQN